MSNVPERKIGSKFKIDLKGTIYRVEVVRVTLGARPNCEGCIFELLHVTPCSIYKHIVGFCGTAREDGNIVIFKPVEPLISKGGQQ